MTINTEESKDYSNALSGRTVLITRTQAQSAEFTSALERYGARVIPCPTIEIKDPESYELLDEAIENIWGYDWLVLSSKNGVEYFMHRFLHLGRKVSDLDNLRVCVIGESTASRLTDLHIHVDVVPEKFKAEGLFAALESYLGGREGFRQLNFLFPRAAVARDYLPQALEDAGARVDVVPAYRTVSPNRKDLGRITAMIEGGGIDCITFTSASTVRNFAKLFDTTDLGKFLSGITVACIGEVTASTASEYGLHTDIQPGEATIPSLARAIAEYFVNRI
jgi:uroporphyrinogen III methyltransferase/synthase